MAHNKIFIDPGHGGPDPGAVNKYIKEKDLNLKVALELEKLLMASSFIVTLSRRDDLDVGLIARCDAANRWPADMFISIHHNAGGGYGYEVYHSLGNEKGRILAEMIGTEFGKAQNRRYVGAKALPKDKQKDYYCVIRETRMMAVLTEYAFLDSADYAAIDTDAEIKQEAAALATAICKYYDVVPELQARNNELAAAVETLRKAGIIGEPAYWLTHAIKGDKVDGEAASALIAKMATRLK